MAKSYIDKIALLYVKDKKLLMARSKGKDAWFIPGGKREEGESDEETLIREIQEELLVDLDEDTIEYYDTFEAQAYGKPEGTIVRSAFYTGLFDGDPVASAEISEIGYFSYADKDKSTAVAALLFDDLYEKGIIE